MNLKPSFDEFERIAATGPVVPVTREVVADTLTPVGVFSAVGHSAGSFLLESVVGGEKWGRYSFVGFEPDCIVRGVGDRFEVLRGDDVDVQQGVDPWQRLRGLLQEWKAPAIDWLPRFWGGAVGYVSYDAVRTFEPTVGASLATSSYEFCFAFGGPLFVFDGFRQTLRVVVPVRVAEYENPRVAYDAASTRMDDALRRVHATTARNLLSVPDPDHQLVLPPSSFDRASFCDAVQRAQEYIRAGDIFQVVLSQRFRLPVEGRDLFGVYRAMRVINPSPYMYFVNLPDVRIAGASPETLVRLEDGVAEVRPIAGTRHRSANEVEDARIAQELLSDPKERAEHVMLVDLGRNDLGRISRPGSVEISEQMIIERFSHVMHITSNVRGELDERRDALDVLCATFPAGTLSGAPKVRAMQIIEELEPESRGIYGGAIGYIGFDGNMDMAIAIRTIVERQDEFWLQAGAGIVEGSNPDAEYDETVNKARAGLVAIAAAKGED